MWGWSAGKFGNEEYVRVFPMRVGMVRGEWVGNVAKDVFPMRVGMVRYKGLESHDAVCFPHACGDGPAFFLELCDLIRFSPCVWGWSALFIKKLLYGVVFPMRVGMVRCGPQDSGVR